MDIIKKRLISHLSDEAVCVILSNEGKLSVLSGRGIEPLLCIYQKTPQILLNASVADKVIGRAAAAILVMGKIDYLYAKVISLGAVEIFKKNNINFEYDKITDYIKNRDRTGICPMEKLAEKYSQPYEIYMALCNLKIM